MHVQGTTVLDSTGQAVGVVDSIAITATGAAVARWHYFGGEPGGELLVAAGPNRMVGICH